MIQEPPPHRSLNDVADLLRLERDRWGIGRNDREALHVDVLRKALQVPIADRLEFGCPLDALRPDQDLRPAEVQQPCTEVGVPLAHLIILVEIALEECLKHNILGGDQVAHQRPGVDRTLKGPHDRGNHEAPVEVLQHGSIPAAVCGEDLLRIVANLGPPQPLQ